LGIIIGRSSAAKPRATENMDKILFITNSHAYEEGLSGGERIAIELYRRWQKKNNIFVFTSNFGKYTWEKCGIDIGDNFVFCSSLNKNKKKLLSYFSLAISYVKRVIDLLLNKRFNEEVQSGSFVYSCSDFWPDSLPAFFAKMKNPGIIWVAAFYLSAPSPWEKNSPYKGIKWWVGLFYWLTQLPVYCLIKNTADMVFVTSQPDVKRFITKNRNEERIVVVRGGVDITESESYLMSGKVIPVNKRKYDACFIGRFHYQKGILELMDIWKLLCIKKPQALLGVIGLGPLEQELRDKINRLGLENNIELLGFLDGQDKYRVFMNSKIVVHPAFYDSGGMAAAEAMAWKLPGVSFDLESLRTYYPKGILKTRCFSLKEFCDNMIKLLDQPDLYERMGNEAVELIRDLWNWDKQAEVIYQSVRKAQ